MRNHDETLTRIRLANPEYAVDPEEMAVLRAMIDEEIAAPSPRRRRSWSTERMVGRRVHPVLMVALAAVVVFALFLPLRYIGERDDTGDAAAATYPPSMVATSVSPPSSPSAPVLPLSVDPTQLQWRRVDMPGLSGGDLFFDSVTAGGPGLIAVGSHSQEFIWTSAAGVDWTPASFETALGYGLLFDVTVGGPGYVAVGSSIWVSSDGISWSEAVLEGPIVGELRAVTVGGPGLVAVGRFSDGLASVYTSTDGVTWSLIPQDGAPEPDSDSSITDIVAVGPGLVAVGHYGDVGAVWTSTDGFEWSRVPVDREVFGYGDTEMLSVAADDSQLIAVGRIANDRNTNYDTMGIWRSTDGISWSVVPVDPGVMSKGTELRSIISTEQGFIAGGMTEDNAAGVWFSPDGTTWTRLETGSALGRYQRQVITDITVFGNSLIAVGWETEPNYEDEALWYESEVVWIGEPSQK